MEATFMLQLRAEVRDRLRAWEIPQKSLAGHLGITEKHMSQIMTGKTGGNPELLERIAGAVGLQIRVVDVAIEVPPLPGRKNKRKVTA